MLCKRATAFKHTLSCAPTLLRCEWLYKLNSAFVHATHNYRRKLPYKPHVYFMHEYPNNLALKVSALLSRRRSVCTHLSFSVLYQVLQPTRARWQNQHVWVSCQSTWSGNEHAHKRCRRTFKSWWKAWTGWGPQFQTWNRFIRFPVLFATTKAFLTWWPHFRVYSSSATCTSCVAWR